MSKNTGYLIGFFRFRDPHPFIDGLHFKGYGKRKGGSIGEDWVNEDQMKNLIETRRLYGKKRDKAEMNRKAAIYRENNREKTRAASKRWRQNNPEKVSKKAKEYRENNREYFAHSEAKRRAKMKSLSIGKCLESVNVMYACAKRLTECTKFQWHVDHIIPVSKNGSHSIGNLQVVPARWNQIKKNTNCDRIGVL